MGAIKYSTGTVSNTLKLGNFVVGNSGVPYGPTSVTGFYSMIDVPGGGYVIYGNKSSQGPSIYVCRSDNELITISSAIAGQSFTTVAQSIEYLNSQSGTIVVDRDIPAIVKSGLVLYLDAGMVSSYSRTGTTWTDLSGSSNNGTLINGPMFSSLSGGYIELDGINDYLSTNFLTKNNFVENQNWTICSWHNVVSNTTSGNGRGGISTNQRWLSENDPGGFGLNIINGNYCVNLTHEIPNSTKSSYESLASTSINYNTIEFITATYDNSTKTVKVYRNGILSNSSTSATYKWSPATGNNRYNLIGTSTQGGWSYYFRMIFYNSVIYNRSLSDTEILQNYNAGLTRFNTKNIVKSNLLLNLDSTNSVSYTGTGSTWVDLSGAGNHSSGIGSPTFDSTSKSFQFDATDDRFTSTISNRFDMYCLEITFKPHKQISSNTAPDNNAYSLLGVRRSIGNNNGINVYEWTGTMTNETVSIWSHDGFATGIVDTVTNDYHTMVFNWNGTSYDIWLDGVQKSTIQRTNGHAQLLTNVTAVDPGYNPGYNYYHKGNISLVRAYNRKLSSSEILQNYYGGPIVTSGLVMALDAGNLVSYVSGKTSSNSLVGSTVGNLNNGVSFSSENGGIWNFDGTNDWIQIPTYTFGNGNWSVNVWVNVDSLSNYNIVSNSSGGPVTNAFGVESSKIFYRNYNGSWQNNIGNTTLSTGNWYMLTWVNYAGSSENLGTMQMFVNGLSDSSIFNSYTTNGGPCDAIGRNWFSYFDGKIGIIQFYNKSLTNSEIGQNYNAQKSRFGL